MMIPNYRECTFRKEHIRGTWFDWGGLMAINA